MLVVSLDCVHVLSTRTRQGGKDGFRAHCLAGPRGAVLALIRKVWHEDRERGRPVRRHEMSQLQGDKHGSVLRGAATYHNKGVATG